MSDSSLDPQEFDEIAEEFVSRYRAGEQPPVSEYVARFPQFATEIQDLFPAMLVMENLKPHPDDTARDPSPLAFGQMGDYRIIREVGRGGMGVVYEAEQVSLGRHVALKVLARDKVSHPKLRQRFEREARAAAKLHHTNIVPVFGVGEADGQMYFVMQFIQGLPLDQVLVEINRLRAADAFSRSQVARVPADEPREVSVSDVARSMLHGSLLASAPIASRPEVATPADDATVTIQQDGDSLEQSAPSTQTSRSATDTVGSSSSSVVLPQKSQTGQKTTYCESVAQIGVQVARALHYAHGQGVLHRDIKPSNLVLDLKGTVWVTDFGLAKLDDDHGITQAGDILGTLRYMSPESFKGQTDARSEVYSLGLTLYELLAFQPAFKQHNRQALIDQVMHADIQPLDQLNPDIPVDLQTVIHKAIDREPQHRYQTAGEFADDLQRILDDQPILARRITTFERLARWSRHNRGLAASLSAVAVLVTMIAISSTIAAGYFQNVSQKLSNTVSTLQATQTTLKSTIVELQASQQAVELQSTENRRLAKIAQTTLADMQTQQGLLAANAGDPATAMLWFANAAAQTPHDPQRQAANRLRARNWMNAAVLPVALRRPTNTPFEQRLSILPGSSLVMALGGNQLTIWDFRLDATLEWTQRCGPVRHAVPSPTGNRLAIGKLNGKVELRSLPDGELLEQFDTGTTIQVLAFSPDGTRLAVGGEEAQLWQISDKPTREFTWPHAQRIHSLLFNRRGTRLITASQDQRARVFALDVPTTSPLFEPLPHAPQTADPPVLLDGDRQLITILENQMAIGWWNAETGEASPLTTDVNTHIPSTIRSLSGSPDGRWCAVSNLASCELWDSTGQHYRLPHPNHVNHAVFTPDSTGVVTTCWDWKCRQWSLAAPQAPPIMFPHLEVANCCEFSPDGEYLVVGGHNEVRIWKQPQSNIVVGQANWPERFWKPRLSFDGRWATPGHWHEVRTAPTDTLQVVDLETGLPAGPPVNSLGIVDSCLCTDNLSVALVSTQGLSVHDVATGRALLSGLPLPGLPLSVAARPGQPQLAVLCKTGHVILIDQRDGSPLQTVQHPASTLDTSHARVRYTPDGRRLIVLTADDDLFICDADTGKPLFDPIRPVIGGGKCRTIALSNDSRWLGTGVNGQNAVQVWDLTTGQAASEPLPHPGDSYGIFAIAFSPDGKWILSGNKDGRARLWDWQTGQLACPPLQHQDEVLDVAFTDDGKFALTGVRNGRASLWELATGRRIAPISYPVPENTSTDTIAVAGDRAIVGARDYPILNLSLLLEEPELSIPSLQTLAELATGNQLELGALSGLSTTDWRGRWEALVQQHNELPQSFAQQLAHDLDDATHSSRRQMIIHRALESTALVRELARLRPEIPELQAALARDALAHDDRSAAEKYSARAIALADQQLIERPHDPAAALLLARMQEEQCDTTWQVLRPQSYSSTADATLTLQPDNSLLVSGPHATADRYSVSVPSPLANVTAVRLEVLPDPSLPLQGPGRHPSGNFQLSGIRLLRGEERLPSPFSDAWASYTYPAPTINVLGPIRPELHAVWHVFGKPGMPHEAVFLLEQPLTDVQGQLLTVELDHKDIGGPINIGRFRLSVTDDTTVISKQRISSQLAQSPQHPWMLLGMTSSWLGHPERATRAFQEAFTQAEDVDETRQLFEILTLDRTALALAADARSSDPFFLTCQAHDLEQQGQHAEARAIREHAGQIVQQRLADNPENPPLAELLALTLVQQHQIPWTLLTPDEMESDTKCALTVQPDGAILTSQPGTGPETYTLRFRGPLAHVTALKLEALPHMSLPGGGSGWGESNFHLTEIRARHQSADDTTTPVPFVAVASDHIRPLDPTLQLRDGPWAVLDDNPHTRWDVWPVPFKPHWLALQFAQPLDLAEGEELVLLLEFHDPGWPEAHLGCFRLSYSTAEDILPSAQLQSLVTNRHITGQAALVAAWLAQGDARKALAVLQSLSDSPEGSALQLLQIQTLRALGETAAARAACQALIDQVATQPVPRPLRPLACATFTTVGGLDVQQAFELCTTQPPDPELLVLNSQIQDSETPEKLQQRALYFARRNRWQEANADYRRSLELAPDDHLVWLQAAPGLIFDNDLDGYRALCRQAFDRFHNTTDPLIAETLCRLCLLHPNDIDLQQLPFLVLKSARHEEAYQPRAPWFTACIALGAFRQGDFPQAVELCTELNKSPTGIRAQAFVIQALAEQSQGHLPKARNLLNRSANLTPVDVKSLGKPNFPVNHVVPTDALTIDHLLPELLRRETITAINTKPSMP